MSETPVEVLKLLAVVGTNPRLRRITIAILQGMEKEDEQNIAVRDIVSDLRVPPSAQAPGPKPERVTLQGATLVEEYRGSDQRGWVDPIPTEGWKPPGQAIIDAMTATTFEKKGA
jgi:hypothetical protein